MTFTDWLLLYAFVMSTLAVVLSALNALLAWRREQGP